MQQRELGSKDLEGSALASGCTGGRIPHVAVAAVAMALAIPAEAQQHPSVAPRNMQELAPALAGYTDDVLFGDVWRRPGLSPRDRSFITIAALIATGKTAQLRGHLGRGLANGIQPAEIAGMTTHLAFYSGWPNAVSALDVIEQVFAERKIDASVLRQRPGHPALLPADDAARAASQDERAAQVSPKLAELTADVVFGDLWRRTDLSPRDRSLVTIAALAANDDNDQLMFHLRRGLENGLTRAELGEAFAHLAFYAGWPKAMAATETARPIFEDRRNDVSETAPKLQIIPAGRSPNAGPASYFTGSVSVASAFKGTDGARLGGATVTFQPAAHTNWHTHPLGQLLIVTAGRGWVQIDGETARPIKAGDTVWITPGVKHWHGAARDSAMTHVAVSEALDGTSVAWLEPVADDDYNKL